MADSEGAVRAVPPARLSSSRFLAPSSPFRARIPAAPDWVVMGLAYFILAVLLRATVIGNAAFHVDEEFYLLVGQRMHQGVLPYIDIWDRKPIELFLLYYLFTLAPGDGMLAYQIAGIGFTAGTALVVARLAREIAPRTAAWQAGIAYLCFMPVFNCALGQAPVFYNLLIALAALGVVEAMKRSEAPELMMRGAMVMLLVGVAIQIKYTVIFEGMAFGLMLLARAFADVWSWRRLALGASAWIAAALLPTALALGVYAAMGHADAFVQANFLSILGRRSDGIVSWWRLTKEMAALFPFWLAIFHAPRRFRMVLGEHTTSVTVLRCWAVAAFAGFFAFGTYYDHYVGPLLVPLCVLAAPALGRVRSDEQWYAKVLLGFGALAAVVVMAFQVHAHGNSAQVETFSELIDQEMRGGCLYVYEGEPVLYRTTRSCLPGRFAFPNHLNTWTEAPALGVNPNLEVARIMVARPDVVVVGEWHDLYLPNYQTRAIVKDFLRQDYERYAGARLGAQVFGLYRLRHRPLR